MNHSKAYQNSSVLSNLEQLYSEEMSGINRYLHYSFVIMGHNRIPIQKWFRDNASESMRHAITIGEKITSLGGHPPVVSALIEETNLHTIDQLLRESLSHEQKALSMYYELVSLALECEDVALEEMAKQFVRDETEHQDEVGKMLVRNIA